MEERAQGHFGGSNGLFRACEVVCAAGDGHVGVVADVGIPYEGREDIGSFGSAGDFMVDETEGDEIERRSIM